MHITTTDEERYHKRELCLDDNTCVSQLYVIDFMMRIGSTPVRMAGIGGVHTDRQHRKKNYMRALYEDSVTYMIDQGYCVSVLFGIENFYIKWGYATSLAQYVAQVKTRDAESAKNLSKAYPARPIKPNDMQAIVNLYNQHNATRTGSIERTPKNFTKFSKGSWYGNPPDTMLWEDKQDNLQGYAVWDRSDKAVKVAEVDAVDDTMFSTILYFLALQAVEKRCETIDLYVPADHPFAEYTQRYGAEWKITFPRFSDGMMRIINQQPLFHTITPELERRIAFSPLHGYTGTLTLETDLGITHLVMNRGHVRVADDESGTVVLALPQQKLMQLLVGYRSVRDVINDNEVQTSGDVVPLLQALFPKGVPYMYKADHF